MCSKSDAEKTVGRQSGLGKEWRVRRWKDGNICDIRSLCVFFFSSRRRHTRFDCDWSSDVCSSDLEAGCDVVVAGKNVSRRHAEIVQTPRGYLLVDSSTNGTFVSETRVEGQRILQRADVIRIGDEQFRFYVDVAPAPAAPAAPPVVPPPAGPPPGPAGSAPQAAPQAPPGASARLRDTMHGFEPAPRPSQAGSLANFLVKSGTLKGQRLQVRTPGADGRSGERRVGEEGRARWA